MRRFNTLTPDDVEKYKIRSEKAINGINMLLQDIPQLLECNTIDGKYTKIATYLGLTEDGDSKYNYFVPLNKDVVFLLRLSNHNNTNESLYDKFEQMCRPDARYIIYFSGKKCASSTNSLWLESQHNVISYPVNSLDTCEDIRRFLITLKTLFTNGKTRFPKLPQGQTTKQCLQTENKTNKIIIPLAESHIRQIVRETLRQYLQI